MAAVEKRKNGVVAMLLNHLMFMIICAFILIPMAGKEMVQNIFGTVLLFVYFIGVHDYCFRAGREHSQHYTKTNPSWKFPLYYGFVGAVLFWIPIIVVLTLGQMNIENYVFLTRLFYLVWDSPFIFMEIFNKDYNALMTTGVTVATLLYFVSSFSGYALGKRGTPLKVFVKEIIAKFKKKED